MALKNSTAKIIGELVDIGCDTPDAIDLAVKIEVEKVHRSEDETYEECIKRAIPILVDEGKDLDQAIAMAHSMCELPASKGGEGSGGAREGAGRPAGSAKPTDSPKPSSDKPSKGSISRDKPIENEKEATEVLKETQKKFNKLKKDNPDLAKGIGAWTMTSYSDIRKIQQGKLDPKDSSYAAERLAMIDKNFEKLPTYEGPISRELMDVDPKKFKEGSDITLDAHSSFTALKSWDRAKKKPSVRLVVPKSKAGKAIWGMSSIDNEMEVLVPKGTKYRVSKIVDGKPQEVHLEEVHGKSKTDDNNISDLVNQALDQPPTDAPRDDAEKALKGGEGSGGTREGAGRPPGSGSDKPSDSSTSDKPTATQPTFEATEIDGHKLSKETQEAYNKYRNDINPVLSKVINARNSGVTSPKLSKEEKELLKKSVKEFDNAKQKFMQDNGMNSKQIAAMKSMTKEWVKDSDNMKALVMRQVMAEETGGNFSKEYRYGEKITKGDLDRVSRVRESIEKKLGGPEKLKAAIKAEIAFNQAMYSLDHGKEGMTVYRGVRTNAPPKIDSTDKGSMKSGASASWSTSAAVANNFASSAAQGEKVNQPLRFSKKVPANDVVFYYKASPAMMSTTLGLGEGEVVVKSKKNQIDDVKIEKLNKAASKNEPITVEDYSTDFNQSIRKDSEEYVEYDTSEGDELFVSQGKDESDTAKEFTETVEYLVSCGFMSAEAIAVASEVTGYKGGDGSGGAREGAGRPRGSGGATYDKPRVVVEDEDNISVGDDGTRVTEGGPRSAPPVYSEDRDEHREEIQRGTTELAESTISPRDNTNNFKSGLYSDSTNSDLFLKRKGADISIQDAAAFQKIAREELERNFVPAMDKWADNIKSQGVDIVSLKTREKQAGSLKEKMNGKWADKTLDKVTDGIGGRMVFKNQQDLDKAIKASKGGSGMSVLEHKDYAGKDSRDDGYNATHLLVKTPGGLVAEMQFKTENQNAWSKWSHHNIYKTTSKPNAEAKTYAKNVGAYLQDLDMGRQPKEKPEAPKSVKEAGLEFPWKSANLNPYKKS